MRVQDLIQSRQEIYTLNERATVFDAARYLRERQVRAAGVRNDRGEVVGIVSQSDVSDKVAAENKCPTWMHVSEIMSTNLVTVPPEMPLDECLRLMEKHNIYHLMVIDQIAGYRGTISVQDLLKVIASDHKDRADMLEAFLFPAR